jgi:hypothetical protein
VKRMARSRAGLRTRRSVAALGATIAAAAVVTAVIAQSSGGATSGGGGTSAASPYELSGSIGQPVSGRASADPYVLDSGIIGGGGAEKFRRIVIAIARDP